MMMDISVCTAQCLSQHSPHRGGRDYLTMESVNVIVLPRKKMLG